MEQSENPLQLMKQKPLQFIVGIGFITLVCSTLITSSFKLSSKSYAFFSSFKFPSIRYVRKQTSLPKKSVAVKHEYYTLREGESLWDVAEKVYNDPYKYIKILELNNITNADILEKGTKLLVK